MHTADIELKGQNDPRQGSMWTARVGQAQPAAQDSAGASSSSSSIGAGSANAGGHRIRLLPVQQQQESAAVERTQLLIGTCLQSILRR